MEFIITLLINAGVLFATAYVMPQIKIRSFGTALLAALLIGLLNATIGFLLRLPLNLMTLFLLGFFVRLFVTALVIKLVDKLMGGFEIQGFWPALVLAIVMAVAGYFTDRLLHKDRLDARTEIKMDSGSDYSSPLQKNQQA